MVSESAVLPRSIATATETGIYEDKPTMMERSSHGDVMRRIFPKSGTPKI